MRATGSSEHPRIVVAGGGPAALEAVLTLAERLAPADPDLTLIAPSPALVYRPLSGVGEFVTHPPHRLELSELAAAVGAGLLADRVVTVDEERRRLLTHDGDWIGFDYLLLAVGAGESSLPRSWLRWPAEGDPACLYTLLQEIGGGRVSRLAVVVPEAAGWPIAGYELAAILGAAAADANTPVAVSLLTEHPRPLAALGDAAESIVAGELVQADVEVRSGVAIGEPPAPETDGGTDWLTAILRRLRAPAPKAPAPGGERTAITIDGERAEFDRVVSLPRNIGPGIGGVRTDARGFVLVDERCRVLDSERVWAAGDCTALAPKHSSLAVAQADAAADALAAAAGAPLDPEPFVPRLTGLLVAGAADRWWRENTAILGGVQPATHCLWWPPGKVLGGRLARYVARRDPAARPLLVGHPAGTVVEVTFPPSAGRAEARSSGGRPPVSEHELEEDSYDRRVYALRRVEREAGRRLEDLQRGLDEERERSARVLDRLNAAGYLVK